MTQPNVAIIVGSLRKESINLKFAKALAKLGEGKFNATFVRIDDLPLMNQDLEANYPANAQRMKDEIAKADGVLIVTPEYNRAIPAPLKNAIDWASRPYGKNSFAKKPLAVVGMSPGTIGTACAQQELRAVFSYLGTIFMGQPEMYVQHKDGMIDADYGVPDEKTRKFFAGFVDTFIAWVEKYKSTN